MPLSNLEIVAEEFLETEYLTVLQVRLLEALLPICYQVHSILLSKATCHSDIASS